MFVTTMLDAMIFRFLKKNSLYYPILFFTFFASVVVYPKECNAVSIESLRIYGYFDLEYEQANNLQGNKNGSFDNHHFNLLMDFPVSNELIIKTHVEFEHGVDSQNDFGTVKLEWAFFEYGHRDELRFRGGKFFSPFGFYNELRDSTPAFLSIDVPSSIYFSQKRGGFDFLPEQNTGVSVWGQAVNFRPFSSVWDLDYALYIGNGENDSNTNPAEFDNNSNKAIGGKLNLYPSDWFRFGMSFFTGDKAILNDPDSPHHTIAASAGFDLGLLNLTSELAFSKFRGVKQYGGYVQTSWQAGIFSPYYRYEYLDPDDSVSDNHWQTHILGLNSIVTRGMNLKTEIDFHDRGRGNSLVTKGQTAFHEYKAAIVISF